MKNSIFFLALVLIFSLSSCLNQKYLIKNQEIYKVSNESLTTSKIETYSSATNMKVIIEESNGMLLIKKSSNETNNFVKKQDVQSGMHPKGIYVPLDNGKFYFNETTYPNSTNGTPASGFISPPSKLMYWENRLVLQTMTIPLKIRPQIRNDRYKDSLPTQVETGFNAGFAFGVKRTWSIFKAETNLLGQNTTRLSVTPGVFFNLGGADVKKLTTNYTITVDRKEPFFSKGVFLMMGFNNINIGYAIGWDNLLTSNKQNWVYEGKKWHGITVALDILK